MFSKIKNQPYAKIYQLKYFILFGGLSVLSYFYFDKTAALFFYKLCQKPGFVSLILMTMSKFVQGVASGAFLFPIIFLSIWALAHYQKRTRMLNFSIIFAWSLSFMNIVTAILKFPIGRARPILYAEQKFFGFDFFNFGKNYLSFPSGHTVNITVFVVITCYFFPKNKWIWISMGILMALMRVVYLKHFPSDVLLSCYLTLLLLPVGLFLLAKFSNQFPQFILIRHALENLGLHYV